MNKLIRNFKFLTLISLMLSFLAACDAASTVQDELNNSDGGGEKLGNATVSGADASAIGTTFLPTVDTTTTLINGSVVVILGSANGDIISQSAVARVLTVAYAADGALLTIAYSVHLTDGELYYRYLAECDANDCSTVDLNTLTKTIIFNNTILFAESGGDPSSSSTGQITLNGSVKYTLQ